MSEEGREVHVEDLIGDSDESVNSLVWLGGVVGASLKNFGIAVLARGEDGAIRWINPMHAYIDASAMAELEEGELSYLRPIVSAGKPIHVAWKEGKLWEVELKG